MVSEMNKDTSDQLIGWFVSDDTGISSIAIAAQLTGNKTGRRYGDYPSDNGDFGRCHRLLKAVPEFRSRIGEMAGRSKQWAALVQHWDELERLHESGGDGCYKRMKEILATAKDEHRVELSDSVSICFPHDFEA